MLMYKGTGCPDGFKDFNDVCYRKKIHENVAILIYKKDYAGFKKGQVVVHVEDMWDDVNETYTDDVAYGIDDGFEVEVL